MDFISVMETVIQRLDAAGVRYALIGGFAMALRGVQRATLDLDFILMLEDREYADRIFRQSGYTLAFRNENVSHYFSDSPEMGRIDLIHAFRRRSLTMLERAERIPLGASLSLPVVRVEDLIGLKVQAARNDPAREQSDWLDIRLLAEAARDQGTSLDWDLISDYLCLFDQSAQLSVLKSWYGTPDPHR